MEWLYKKLNLKFSGFANEYRKKEIESNRNVAKYQQMSILRSITDENISRIPQIVAKSTSVTSRIERLQKWKKEKLLKQEREKLAKKPPFKVSLALKPVSSSLKSTHEPGFQTSGSSSKSNMSQVKSVNTSKLTSLKPSLKAPTISSSTTAPVKKQILAPQKSASLRTSALVKNPTLAPQESASLRTAVGKKPTFAPQESASSRTAAVGKKPTSAPHSLHQQSVSSCLRSSSHLSKEVVPSKASQKPLSFKPALRKGIKSKEATTASASTLQKTGKNSLKEPTATTDPVAAESSETAEPIFVCDISNIEPPVRKSFAPANFMFRPPVNLSLSCFDVDDPFAIFSRVKTENKERTSTPLKNTDSSKLPASLKTTQVTPPSTTLREIDQNSIPLKETDVSLKSDTLKETDVSLNSDTLKETDVSLNSDTLKETSPDSLKETSPDSMQNSVPDINKDNIAGDSGHKACLKNKDESKVNDADISFDGKQPVLEHDSDNITPKADNIHSEDVKSISPKETSLNNSIDFEKFIYEHGDEPLDTFSVTNGNSLMDFKVSDMNLPEARQSGKSRGTRAKAKQSTRPILHSIRESSENKPCLNETPKLKAAKDDNFTPRRSARLAEKLRRSSSFENLLLTRRPSIMESIDIEDPGSAGATGVTVDFQNLDLGDTPVRRKDRKVSLLYTPPVKKKDYTPKSVKGNLILFSP